MGRPALDLTGKRFGKLTAIEIYERCGYHKPVKWRCKCDCGREKIVDSQCLRRGIVTDCGCKIRDRLVGQRFGRLTVLEASDKKQKGKCGDIYWKCQCDCGNITYVQTCNLISKTSPTLSCGCLRKEKITKHNLSNTKIYKTLVSMKARCFNPKNPEYKNYGARGIKICDEWLNKSGFENFYKWSIENGYRDELSIDRINNDGNYEPLNCRWTNDIMQNNNTRRNRYVTINNETHSLSEWARIKEINISTIRCRLDKGWSEKESILTPIMKHGHTRDNPKYAHDS